MQIFNFFDGNFALSVKGVSFLVFSVFAVAAIGYLLGVNPFNQPGVEFYKRNMFKLLGKPGYEN